MHREKQGKTSVARLFVLLAVLFCYPTVACELNIGSVVSNEAIMVNNVWVDVPLTQVFRDISIETGTIIATCPHVSDPLVSLDAGSGKPLKECLEELVAGQGLFIYQKKEKFYLVSCGDPACPSALETMTSKRLYLKYITATHLQSSLPKAIQKYVTSGERENEVFVYAVPEIAKHIMEIVHKLDIPRQQIMLEVLVVDIWEDSSDEFGIDWEYSGRHNSLSMTGGVGAFTGIASYASVAASNLTELGMTLRALVGENKASIRSRPRVATLNGEKATIDISLDEYFTIARDLDYGGSLRTELQIIKSGVFLEITPHIGDDNDVTVDILTEISDVVARQNEIAGNRSGDLPIIRCRKANTRVRVKLGDAVVIGGLVETKEQSDNKRVPLLSDIPLIGGLFKSKENTIVKKEVMIFITPRLMNEGEILLSNRHKLIDETLETEKLRDVATLFDVRYNSQHAHSEGEEIQCLNEAIALLDGQELPGNLSHETSPDVSEDLSHSNNLLGDNERELLYMNE